MYASSDDEKPPVLAQPLLMTLLVALPLLWPLTTDPSPSVMPWLATLLCLALFALSPSASRVRPRAVPLGFLLASVLSCLVGLLQFFDATHWLGALANHSVSGEVYGNLRQRNQFATLTNMGLLALLLLRGAAAAGAWLGLAGAVVAVLLGVGNALALSRTGLVQLLMLIGMAWVWGLLGGAGQREKVIENRGERADVIAAARVDTKAGGPVSAAAAQQVRWVLLAALLAYALASVGLALSDGERSVLGRFADGAPACSSRLTLWANVLHLIAQKPWLGWGWGNLDYAHFITLYDGERFCDILDNAHNLPLHLAVELGLPLALLFCGLLLWWVWRNRPWAERHPMRQLAWGVLALIGLHSLLEYPLWYGPFLMSALLCVWLLWALPRGADVADAFEGNQPIASEFIGKIATNTIAIALLAATAYAAWDYHRISQIYRQPEERSAAYREDTLQKAQASWLFAPQVQFAQVVLTPVTRDNAAAMRALTDETLHYSPEARVIEKRIEAASLLDLDDEALYYALRFKRAFPQAYAQWVENNAAIAAGLKAKPASAAQ